MKRNLIIVLFLLFLFAPIAVAAQSALEPGLVLEGKVEKCAAAEIENPELSCYKLRMVFRNDGTEPVIIINPTLGYGTGLKLATFYFKYQDYDTKKYIFFENTGESVVVFKTNSDKTENFKSMALLFDGDRPPENMTIVLQPNETYVFTDRFEVKRQYKNTASATIPVIEPSGKKSKIVIQSHRESAKHFRLTYEFSFLPYVSEPDLLEKLSLRWKRLGRLPVGTNGTYTITSSPSRKFIDCEIVK